MLRLPRVFDSSCALLCWYCLRFTIRSQCWLFRDNYVYNFDYVGCWMTITWICWRRFFTDSTVVNHHFAPSFGIIFLELVPSIFSKSKSMCHPCRVWILPTYLPIYSYIWSNYSDLTRPHPKWWFSKFKGDPRLFQGNLGWWNIIIWPDTSHYITSHEPGWNQLFNWVPVERRRLNPYGVNGNHQWSTFLSGPAFFFGWKTWGGLKIRTN